MAEQPTPGELKFRIEKLEEDSATVGEHSVTLAELNTKMERFQTDVKSVNEALQAMNTWLKCTMGGIIVALLLLIVDLVTGHKTSPPHIP
jgi:uncharacterized coiled-coil protein SlyX